MEDEVRLRVCLFGAHPLEAGCVPFNLSVTGTTRKLIYYLLLFSGREINREFLADLFWRNSGASRQRSALNSAIWRIKKQFRSFADLRIESDGEYLVLHLAPGVSCDAVELKETVAEAGDHEIDAKLAARLADVLARCDAPFMNGAVEDWALAERERLYNLRLRGLAMLMRWLGRERHYDEALEIGRKLLQLDPFREAAQCEVMWLYVLNGQRAQALRQYQSCAALLRRQLQIEPIPEMRALYEYIRGGLDLPAVQVPADRPAGPRRPSEELNGLLDAIEESRRQIYRTLCDQIS